MDFAEQFKMDLLNSSKWTCKIVQNELAKWTLQNSSKWTCRAVQNGLAK
jgi:hypothetical protein